MKTNSALVAKFRKAADGLENQIQHLGRPMTQNPTPKRNKEYQSRLHDCRNLERLQKALRALADGHEAGNLPADLSELKTRDEIARLVHKGLDGSRGGYYSVIECDDYDYKTVKARKLQSMIDGNAAHRAERERRRQIESLAAQIALANIPGYFPTQEPAVLKLMAERAQLSEGLAILEPSAGSGHIADWLTEHYKAKVDCIEPNGKLRELLTLKGYNLVGHDFTVTQPAAIYDRVLMNPPFEKQQDIEHVRRAWSFLKPGGILVAIMAPSFEFRTDRKSKEFREWLSVMPAKWESLPDGSFKKSGTGVSTRLVVISKPEAKNIARPAAQPAAAPIAAAALQPGQVETLFGPQFREAIRKRPPVLTANPAQLSLF